MQFLARTGARSRDPFLVWLRREASFAVRHTVTTGLSMGHLPHGSIDVAVMTPMRHAGRHVSNHVR